MPSGSGAKVRAAVAHTLVRAVYAETQEFVLDQTIEQRSAQRVLEAEQPLGLRFRELQSGHFQVFRADAIEKRFRRSQQLQNL